MVQLEADAKHVLRVGSPVLISTSSFFFFKRAKTVLKKKKKGNQQKKTCIRLPTDNGRGHENPPYEVGVVDLDRRVRLSSEDGPVVAEESDAEPNQRRSQSVILGSSHPAPATNTATISF